MKDSESLLYFMLAYWTWKNNPNSPLPEILYILDIEEVIKFIKIFGGKTFKVPTWGDLSNELKEGLSAYLHKSEGCSHDYIRTLLEIDGRSVLIERKLKRSSKGVTNDYAAITIDGEKIEERTDEEVEMDEDKLVDINARTVDNIVGGTEIKAMKYFLISMAPGTTTAPYISIAFNDFYLNYGQSASITPSTTPTSIIEEYRAVLNDTTYFDIVVTSGGNVGDAGAVNTNTVGGSKTVIGKTFSLISKNTSSSVRLCTVTITGINSGASASITGHAAAYVAPLPDPPGFGE